MHIYLLTTHIHIHTHIHTYIPIHTYIYTSCIATYLHTLACAHILTCNYCFMRMIYISVCSCAHKTIYICALACYSYS